MVFTMFTCRYEQEKENDFIFCWVTIRKYLSSVTIRKTKFKMYITYFPDFLFFGKRELNFLNTFWKLLITYKVSCTTAENNWNSINFLEHIKYSLKTIFHCRTYLLSHPMVQNKIEIISPFYGIIDKLV